MVMVKIDCPCCGRPTVFSEEYILELLECNLVVKIPCGSCIAYYVFRRPKYMLPPKLDWKEVGF